MPRFKGNDIIMRSDSDTEMPSRIDESSIKPIIQPLKPIVKKQEDLKTQIPSDIPFYTLIRK